MRSYDGDLASKAQLDRRARRNGFNQHTSRLHARWLGRETQGLEKYPIAFYKELFELYSVKVPRRVLACFCLDKVAAYLLRESHEGQRRTRHSIESNEA